MAIEAGKIDRGGFLHGVDHSYYDVPVGAQAALDPLIPCQPSAAVFQSPFCLPMKAPADYAGLSRNENGKRRREWCDYSFSVLGIDEAFRIQCQQRELDRLVSLHTQRLRVELEERASRRSKVLELAVREAVTAAIREKDEEISSLTKLNWALNERIRTIGVENDLWRGLAQSNEAKANSLRTDLERVLMSSGIVEDRRAIPEGNDNDAESCCGSSDATPAGLDDDDAASDVVVATRRGCKGSCGGRNEARVLVMPCRHLCLCTACGSGSRESCPVCGSDITASVHVNFSPN